MDTIKSRHPAAESIAGLLTNLLGHDCRVEQTKLDVAIFKSGGLWTFFVDDEDAPVAVAAADLAFSVFSGAAISMLPAGAAQDALEEGRLESHLAEATAEVLNVLSRLLNEGGGPHVRLQGVHHCGEGEQNVTKIVNESAARTQYSIAIEGYGSGSLVIAAA